LSAVGLGTIPKPRDASANPPLRQNMVSRQNHLYCEDATSIFWCRGWCEQVLLHNRRLTCLLVGQGGIQMQADRSRRMSPLSSQVIRGAHDQQPLRPARSHILMGHAEGKPGLARCGRRHGQEICDRM